MAVLLCRGFFGGGGFAYFETGEAGDGHILAELGDLGFDELLNGERRFLDERLFEQADLFVELGETAFDDPVDDLFGLAFSEGASAGDILLFFEDIGGNVFAAEIQARGSAAAMCIATSWTNSLKSSVRATKSDSQFTSTITPSCPPAWM